MAHAHHGPRAAPPRLSDGILARARSHDLRAWELQPPLTEPAGFGRLEVPQVWVVDGRPLVVFSCHPEEQSPGRLACFVPHFEILDPIPVALRGGRLERV